jgi:hypothetical protein
MDERPNLTISRCCGTCIFYKNNRCIIKSHSTGIKKDELSTNKYMICDAHVWTNPLNLHRIILKYGITNIPDDIRP